MTIMSNSFWRIALTSALHSVIICATCGRERGELDQPPWPLDFDSGLLTSLTFSLSLRVINLNISARSLGSTVHRAGLSLSTSCVSFHHRLFHHHPLLYRWLDSSMYISSGEGEGEYEGAVAKRSAIPGSAHGIRGVARSCVRHDPPGRFVIRDDSLAAHFKAVAWRRDSCAGPSSTSSNCSSEGRQELGQLQGVERRREQRHGR
jgi:hypothetical protein